MLIELRAKVNPWTVWLVGGELVIVGACLAAGSIAGWSVQTLAIIAPTGATAVTAWPAAVVSIRKAVEGRDTGGPGGTSMDGVKLILLPATARTCDSAGESSRYRFDDTEIKWRITGSADNFEIVRAYFSRRWRSESKEGEVRRENGLLVAFFKAVPTERRKWYFGGRHTEVGVTGRWRPIKGRVTLVDGRNKLYRYPVAWVRGC
jgi:hypothetical protein